LVTGEPVSAPKQVLKEGLVEQSQQYLPNKFECVACGMKIAGHSQLNAIGLGAMYAQTSTYTVADLYGEAEPEGWEDDNNEYYLDDEAK